MSTDKGLESNLTRLATLMLYEVNDDVAFESSHLGDNSGRSWLITGSPMDQTNVRSRPKMRGGQFEIRKGDLKKNRKETLI